MACGVPIPVAPWVCPDTLRAGEVTVEIFQHRPGLRVVLLRNHGLVATGRNLEHAFAMAYDVEVGFQAYHQALQVGRPVALTPGQLAEIKAAYHL